jgi:hypothetical protein
MKKIFTILCAVLLTFSLSAQYGIGGDVKFGIVGGLNIAYPVGDDMEDFIGDFDDMIDDYDDQSGVDADGGIKPRIGMHFGLSVDFPVADNLYITSGAVYSQKGFVLKQEIESDGYSGYFYYTGNTFDTYYPGYGYGYFTGTSYSGKSELKISTNLNYIDIPIGIKYATDDGFELSGGLMLSFLASDKVNADYDDDIPSSYYNNSNDPFDDVDDYEDMWGEDPEDFLTGFQLAVGYTFNDKFNISFKLQKTGEFGEIDDEDENKNLTLQLSTGLYF